MNIDLDNNFSIHQAAREGLRELGQPSHVILRKAKLNRILVNIVESLLEVTFWF